MSQNSNKFNKIDLNNVIESFKQLAQYVDKGLAKIAPYLQSLKNGFTQANKSAQKLGHSVKNMMQLDGLGDKVGQNFKKAMMQLDSFGKKIEQNLQKAMDKASGFFAKGVNDIMKFLTPLAGGAMVSAAFTTYIEGVKETEEAAKKAGQTVQEYQASQGLATYTEQDIELSKEWTKNQEELAVSLESVNAVIMRMLLPNMNAMGQGIKKFIAYIQKNENDVKAFFIVLGVFALALGAKMALAFAPMIVTAAGFSAIIAVISYALSDLFTYLEGGESKLSDFWSIFGTGEEISAALASAWETLKAVGMALWETLKTVGLAFWDTLQARIDDFFTAFGPCIENVKGMFSGFFTFLEGLFTLDFDMMGEGLLATFINVFEGIANLVQGFFDFMWSGLERICSAFDLSETISAALTAATDAFQSFIVLVEGLFTGLTDFLWSCIEGLLDGLVGGAKKLLSFIPGFDGDNSEDSENEGFLSSGAKKLTSMFSFDSDDEDEETTSTEKAKKSWFGFGDDSGDGDGSNDNDEVSAEPKSKKNASWFSFADGSNDNDEVSAEPKSKKNASWFSFGSDDEDKETASTEKAKKSWFGFGGFGGFGDDSDNKKDENGLTGQQKWANIIRNLGLEGGEQSNKQNGTSIGVSPADAVAVNTPSYNQSNQNNQTNNIQNTQSTNVGTINIQTNATDANGIARDIQPAINRQWGNLVMASNMGVMK